MAPTTSSLPTDPRPIIISGPSGVGKGTLYKRLLSTHPHAFATSISHTTRAPRPGEERDVDYHFVTRDAFAALVAADGFVEHAEFGSNSYGTSKATIAQLGATGKVVLLDIEMEGLKQIKKSGMDMRYVFVAPPSFEALEVRLRGRGTETEESIQKRLAQGKREMEFAKTEGVHDVVVVNDDVDRAYAELEGWIFGQGKKTQG